MRASTWILLILLLLLGVGGYAFYIQNSERAVMLSWNIYVAAWKLSSPVQVPALMAACLLIGGVPTLVWGLWQRALLRGEIRKLQQELALSSRARRDTWEG